MHGGALVSLADTAVVTAIKSVLEPGAHFAAISLETRIKRPVTKAAVEARAAIVERSGSIIIPDATFALAPSTCRVFAKRREAGEGSP
jgi:uncharacterized protein (TIGR00369 family)